MVKNDDRFVIMIFIQTKKKINKIERFSHLFTGDDDDDGHDKRKRKLLKKNFRINGRE